MTKRPPGRPYLSEDGPSVVVTVRLAQKEFDAYCARAKREEVSIPEIIRRELRRSEVLIRRSS